MCMISSLENVKCNTWQTLNACGIHECACFFSKQKRHLVRARLIAEKIHRLREPQFFIQFGPAFPESINSLRVTDRTSSDRNGNGFNVFGRRTGACEMAVSLGEKRSEAMPTSLAKYTRTLILYLTPSSSSPCKIWGHSG